MVKAGESKKQVLQILMSIPNLDDVDKIRYDKIGGHPLLSDPSRE